jgi:hypothetical protein
LRTKNELTTTVILLDVDGVLVYDGGYRASVVATIDHLAAEMGLRGMSPTEDEIDAFHAAGFTNEWDLNPFVVGILWLAAAQGEPVQRPDYPAWAARSQTYAGRPSERALAALLAKLAVVPLRGGQRARLADKMRTLLADTHNVHGCPTTQVFQEFVLGSRLYSAHYGLPSRFATPSLLEIEDDPALTPAGRACVERLVVKQGARVCVYTARPSGPPSAATQPAVLESPGPWALPQAGGVALAPEAELAVQMVGLEQYPLVSMGRMQWLANRHNETVEALTKPSPVQLLAALGAAVSGEEGPVLEAAYALHHRGELQPPLADLASRPLQVFVLEDATPGLEAAANGMRLLQAHGFSVELQGIGVTRSAAKAAALAPYCDVLVPDVNAGLAWIEDRVQRRRSPPRHQEARDHNEPARRKTP